MTSVVKITERTSPYNLTVRYRLREGDERSQVTGFVTMDLARTGHWVPEVGWSALRPVEPDMARLVGGALADAATTAERIAADLNERAVDRLGHEHDAAERVDL